MTNSGEYLFPHKSRVSQPAVKETVLCGVLQLLAFIAVWLRLWSRRMVRKKLDFSDYAILVALFFCVALLAIAITSTVWSGKGFHTQDIDPAYRSRVFVAFTAGQPTWGAANTAVKFSVLYLYLGFLHEKHFRRAAYAFMVIATCYFVSVFLETFLVCKPVQYNWNKKIHGTCTPHAKETYLTAGILNLLVDMLIVALPMPALFRLRMPKGKKIGLIAIFSVGGIICIVSLLRVIYIARMDIYDFHYTYAGLGMWSIVEPQLGIINACMPVTRPFLVRIGNSKLAHQVLPASWLSSAHSINDLGRDGSPVVTFGGGGAGADAERRVKREDEKFYPLDTVHLVGDGNAVKTEVSVTDFGLGDSDLERGLTREE